MLSRLKLFIPFIIYPILTGLLGAQVKETHQIIEEWVKTKQLISEEEHTWKSEKSALIDLEDALVKEIAELEEKLLQFEEENIGAAKQRADLSNRKEKAQNASILYYESMQKIEKEVKFTENLLPTPLRDRLSTFYEKIDSQLGEPLPLRNRLDASVGLLQSIHLFHRSVHVERQEFSLDDGKSREFRVLYFGLGVAYFVNDSGTVAGWGKPLKSGWQWTRKDELAQEITAGVSMMENRALPRFLKLPLPVPANNK
ncbi:MAG: DUF3450 family protein [Opitutae bacterium]|jgi:hypothetical protein|nr:DUF3450 family protein [Opitutae bacterium]